MFTLKPHLPRCLNSQEFYENVYTKKNVDKAASQDIFQQVNTFSKSA